MGAKKTFLADFHLHSTFSDGKLSIPEIIDLYGRAGFGAIAITDHIAEKSTLIGKAAVLLSRVLTEATYPLYRELLKTETERAWDQYQMVVISGFEFSKNSVSNHRSAHVLGIGLTEYMDADADVAEIAKAIRSRGGVSIAAHPVYSGKLEKQTYHLWNRREELSHAFDAWEVASGSVMFDEVAKSNLPKIASSDMHIPRHFSSWKTLLRSELKQDAILDSIRRQDLKFHYYDGARTLAMAQVA